VPRLNGKPEFAVIGLGRFGSSLALTLAERGFSVLGIDRDRSIVQALADRLTQTVALDSTDEQALRAVDIPSFDTVVVAIGSNFEANLLTTVAVKSLGVPTSSVRRRQIASERSCCGSALIVSSCRNTRQDVAWRRNSPLQAWSIKLRWVSSIALPNCAYRHRSSDIRCANAICAAAME